jgi:hypothetical protein
MNADGGRGDDQGATHGILPAAAALSFLKWAAKKATAKRVK